VTTAPQIVVNMRLAVHGSQFIVESGDL